MPERGPVVESPPGSRVDWWARNQGWVLYPLACLSYAALGLAWKPALNWIVGPLWVLLVVWVVPATVVRVIGWFR